MHAPLNSREDVLWQWELDGCVAKWVPKIDTKSGYLWAAVRSCEITRYTGGSGRAGRRVVGRPVLDYQGATFGVVASPDALCMHFGPCVWHHRPVSWERTRICRRNLCDCVPHRTIATGRASPHQVPDGVRSPTDLGFQQKIGLTAITWRAQTNPIFCLAPAWRSVYVGRCQLCSCWKKRLSEEDQQRPLQHSS